VLEAGDPQLIKNRPEQGHYHRHVQGAGHHDGELLWRGEEI